jgi:hypothetical protein
MFNGSWNDFDGDWDQQQQQQQQQLEVAEYSAGQDEQYDPWLAQSQDQQQQQQQQLQLQLKAPGDEEEVCIKHSFAFLSMQPEAVGWPSSTIMTTLLGSVTAASSSISSSLSTSLASTGILNGSLDSYLVLDSACSHRPVFRIRGFFRTIAYDASVKMVDSNGKSTVAEGIGEAMCSLTTVSPTGAPAGSVNLAFSEAVLST